MREYLIVNDKSIRDVWSKRKAPATFGLFLLQLLGIYGLIQLFLSGGIVPRTGWDAMISIEPTFLIPYVLYYPLIFIPFYLGWKKEDESNHSLYEVALTFFIAGTICNALFVVFPTQINRPAVVGSGFFYDVLRFMHSVDGSVGIFPSAHVTYSLLANLITWHFDKTFAYAILPITLLIMPATVFLKQHYVVDIFGGILLAVAVYAIVYRWWFQH